MSVRTQDPGGNDPGEGCVEYQAALSVRQAWEMFDQIADLREALAEYVTEFGGLHEEDCPEDDTCECASVKRVNRLLSVHKPRVWESEEQRKALERCVEPDIFRDDPTTPAKPGGKA